MTDLDVALTPAQWEHWARHGWTLTTAPTTECRNSLHDGRSAPVSEYHCPECGRAPYRSKDGDWYCFDPKGESTCRWRGPNPLVTPCCSPVPATVPCPECEGSRSVGEPGYTYYGVPEPGSYEPCPRCMDDHGIPTGVVPRVVGIMRPERECPECDGSALVAICGPAEFPEGTLLCVLRSGHWGPHYGEDDVAGDWAPAAPCRICCVCPACGSSLDAETGRCETCPYVGARAGFIPAERVGTATVTPVPVVDGNPFMDEDEPGYVERPALARHTTPRGGFVLAYCPADERWTDVTALFATPPNPDTTVWRLDKENDR